MGRTPRAGASNVRGVLDPGRWRASYCGHDCQRDYPGPVVSTVVFGAVLGVVAALRLTPLWGIVGGMLAAIAGVAGSAAVLLGAVNTDPGMAIVARDACVAIFAACGVLGVLVARAIVTGSFGPVRRSAPPKPPDGRRFLTGPDRR